MYKADTVYGTKIEWQNKVKYGIDFLIAQGVAHKASESKFFPYGKSLFCKRDSLLVLLRLICINIVLS